MSAATLKREQGPLHEAEPLTFRALQPLIALPPSVKATLPVGLVPVTITSTRRRSSCRACSAPWMSCSKL